MTTQRNVCDGCGLVQKTPLGHICAECLWRFVVALEPADAKRIRVIVETELSLDRVWSITSLTSSNLPPATDRAHLLGQLHAAQAGLGFDGSPGATVMQFQAKGLRDLTQQLIAKDLGLPPSRVQVYLRSWMLPLDAIGPPVHLVEIWHDFINTEEHRVMKQLHDAGETGAVGWMLPASYTRP